MREKPRRLIRDAKRPVQLMRGRAFFTRTHQVHRKEPLMQRDFGTFHDRANRHRELFTAFRLIALVHAGAMRLALKASDLLRVRIAAMRAIRSERPTLSLKPNAGFIGVLKAWIGEVHG